MKTLKNKIQAIADQVGGKLYEGYSGRGMFGAECYGVECKHSQVDIVVLKGKRMGLKDARYDELGLQAIIYWPSAKYKI